MRREGAVLRLACLAILISFSARAWASGLFASPQSYRSGGWDAGSIAVADVNRDGRPDLLVGNFVCHGTGCPVDQSGVGILLGNGDGTFQPSTLGVGTGGSGFPSISVADLNNDGLVDLIISNHCFDSSHCDAGGGVGVLLSNGDGTFQTAQSYKSGGGHATSVTVADVNGDGAPDLLVANGCFTDDNCYIAYGPTGKIGVLLGNGDGTFKPVVSYHSGGSDAVAVVSEDVNKDGKADLLVANQSLKPRQSGAGVVGVLLGNGEGTFRTPVSYGDPDGSILSSIAVSDVNGDGVLDIMAGDYLTVRVMLGKANGTFRAAVSYTTGGERALSVAVGDVNGDGKPDLVAGSQCERETTVPWRYCLHGHVGVLLGHGDGTFGELKTLRTPGQVADSIALADVNLDNRPDLIVANLCAQPLDCGDEGGAVVYLSKSGFRTFTDLTSGINPSIYGQAVSFAATVRSTGPNQPLGTVTFKNGAQWLGNASLSNGAAMLTTRNLPGGTLSITARYNGDADSVRSASAALNQHVSAAPSTTVIQSSMNPSVQGQPVTFTALVTSSTASTTGTVTFRANGEVLGTVTLVGQKASVTTSVLPRGNSWITAFFNGAPNFASSKASLIQAVK